MVQTRKYIDKVDIICGNISKTKSSQFHDQFKCTRGHCQGRSFRTIHFRSQDEKIYRQAFLGRLPSPSVDPSPDFKYSSWSKDENISHGDVEIHKMIINMADLNGSIGDLAAFKEVLKFVSGKTSDCVFLNLESFANGQIKVSERVLLTTLSIYILEQDGFDFAIEWKMWKKKAISYLKRNGGLIDLIYPK